jgi:hypothetical protein
MWTIEITPVNDLPTGSVTIQGDTGVGQSLQAVTTTLEDADGLGPLHFRWWVDGTEIVGATTSRFTPDRSHLGHVLTVQVDYLDGGGTTETVTSVATGPIRNSAPSATGQIVTLPEDTSLTLSADLLGFGDVNGDAFVSVDFVELPQQGQLQLAGQAVAAGQTVLAADVAGGRLVYTPPPQANGLPLAQLTYTLSDGLAASAPATLELHVTAVNDAPTGGVRIDGNAMPGQWMRADVGTLDDADGLAALDFQWLADDQPIAGATGQTFAPGRAQVGRVLTVQVRYTDAGGTQERITSEPTAIVGNTAPTAAGGTATLAEDTPLIDRKSVV